MRVRKHIRLKGYDYDTPHGMRYYKPPNRRHYTLGDIIKMYKQICTKKIRSAGFTGEKVFQPNFYEHIIRSEASLDRIRRYILNNPYVEYQEIPWKKLDPNV